MGEQLIFTREDADRLTRIETLMKTMDGKIDTLTESIVTCQTNCAGRRKGVSDQLDRIDTRLDGLEKQNTEELGFLRGRKSDIAIVVGGVALAGTIFTIYRLVFP